MSATQLSICNSALMKIGAATVISLTDPSKGAQLCSQRYQYCLDFVTREHPWPFAIKRVILAPTTVQLPFYGSTQNDGLNDGTMPNYFQLPSDFLKYVQDDFSAPPPLIEGNNIVEWDDSFNLRYVAQITDPTICDSQFVEAVAWFLAADICYAMTESTEQQQNLYKSYTVALSKAKFYASGDTANQQYGNELFIKSRRVGIMW
jgi:hypothetical protein